VFEPVAPTPPVDVALAQVRPLTFGSPSRFRPGGPTRLASHAYARDLAEVQALGRADSTVRSPAQTEVARFWSENTFVQWGRNLSAHGCWTTALVHTLGVFFGTDRVRLTVDSTVTGTSRHYRSLREVVREVRLARIAGGLHFRHSMGDGEHLGRRVARHVTRHHFQRR
jgi:hypothetical protein